MVVRCELEVGVLGPEGRGIDRHGPDLRALAADPEVGDTPVYATRSDGEAHDLVAPEPVVERGGEERPVASGLEALAFCSA